MAYVSERTCFHINDSFSFSSNYVSQASVLNNIRREYIPPQGGGTLGISGWGCAAVTLEPLAYTRASLAEFCYPILKKTSQIPPSIDTIAANLRKFKLADLIFLYF